MPSHLTKRAAQAREPALNQERRPPLTGRLFWGFIYLTPVMKKKIPAELDHIADVVLAYKPKLRQNVNGIIGCERSGVVRAEFRKLGHEVYSNDLVPADDGSPFHIVGDAIEVARSRRWDFAIFHPPCTRLTVAGARWFKGREQEQADAIAFAEALWEMDIPMIALENPIGVLSTKSRLGKPTQIIQPWQFGHGEVKATCLWLKGFEPLRPTNIVDGRIPRVHFESPGIVNGMSRQQRRSITYPGIADAMAAQWSKADCV